MKGNQGQLVPQPAMMPLALWHVAARPTKIAAMKTITIREGKERSLQRRHPWVFESSIAKGRADAGETVRVQAHDGSFLAWAAFSPSSSIRVRAWSFDEHERIDAVDDAVRGDQVGFDDLRTVHRDLLVLLGRHAQRRSLDGCKLTSLELV